MQDRALASFVLTLPVIGLVVALFISCVVPILYFAVFFGYGNYQVRGHQEFATNGVSQIEPARQMDRIYADCRHYITYKAIDLPLFNSVAYFGERYKLTMQVPVEIESATSGAMIGEPQFYLSEIYTISISPTGQISASSSRGLNFGAAEWTQVYDADGDFGIIEFEVNPTPVALFQKYVAAAR